MSENNIKKFKTILAKILLIEESKINDELSRKTIEEWDSMTHLMLVSELESAFEITMYDDDIIEIQTIADIKKVLKKLGISI